MDGTVSGDLYPDRHAGHKYMGPTESCEKCRGRGWFPDTDEEGHETGERYCTCPCGKLRRELERGS
jgi:hypothetical protein